MGSCYWVWESRFWEIEDDWYDGREKIEEKPPEEKNRAVSPGNPPLPFVPEPVVDGGTELGPEEPEALRLLIIGLGSPCGPTTIDPIAAVPPTEVTYGQLEGKEGTNFPSSGHDDVKKLPDTPPSPDENMMDVPRRERRRYVLHRCLWRGG